MTTQGQALNISRRGLLQVAGLAISIPALAELTACSDSSGGPVGGGDTGELVVPYNSSPWSDAYKKVAATYQQETGVKVTLREFPYDGLRGAMINAIHGGNETFDVFHLDEPWTGEFYNNGWVAPFADVDSSFKIDPKIADYSNLLYWDRSARTFSKSGQAVALPLEGSLTLFMYRKDLYKELGLSVPKTFDEAYAHGRAAQQAGKAKYGYVARAQAATGGQSVTFDFMPLLYGYGSGWFDEKWKPLLGTPEAIKAMEMYRKLLTLGPAHANTVGLSEVLAAMESGDALQIHTVASAAAQIDDPSASRVAGKVGFAPMPAGTAGSVPASNVWSLAIPKANSKKRQRAALKYISWLLEKSTQTTFAKDGGLPTRSDVLRADAGHDPAFGAIAKSLTTVRPALRYTFTAKMVAATEPALSSMAIGKTPVKSGMTALAGQLADIAREAGYGN